MLPLLDGQDAVVSVYCEIFRFCFGVSLEMWWFLMALVVRFLWSETLSFRDLLVSPMYSAVQLLARYFWW